jgi:hypothetical protein
MKTSENNPLAGKVKEKKMKDKGWIGKAERKMKEKGTLGKFGKATAKKIAAAKKRGGIAKKRAIFAENMKRISQKRRIIARRK